MRLIDADALIESFEPDHNQDWYTPWIIDKINDAPTVEAKPVVHCKDCVHWGTGVAGETEHVKCCEYGKYMVCKNGYCCYADMRGEKHD